MDLLTLLNQKMQPLYDQVKTLLFRNRVDADVLTLNQYQQLLYVNLAYHRALEAALVQQAPYLPNYDRLRHCKTPYLVADLLATGAPLPLAYPTFFAHWNAWQLLGAAYVGEEIAFDGQTITTDLQRSPVLPAMARISRFFNGPKNENWAIACQDKHAKGHEADITEGAVRALGIYERLAGESTLPSLAA